ncbi:hypothetical protein [Paractinoplanes durhamensis]|uniref:Uncharacterized protein n=1 Tax=Paractinoplanes durhamensis TaxID=113563 RepID=A0ABQ3ZBV0_9ACTN|nr:hypothetical protein [Actinoplanes durhamensis]GIE07302.1 hypothetical protein Adu01nite_86520 [Actinoplanes durhamensis]
MATFKPSKDFDKIIQDLGKKAIQEVKRKDQPVLDRLHREYAGKPVEVVKPAMARALKAAGWTLSDRELTDYAEIISRGDRIVLR